MSGHTPGPWWCSGLEVGTVPVMQVKTARADGANHEEALANARLMAESPAMLALLRDVVRRDRETDNIADAAADLGECAYVAAEIIKRIEGGA